MLVDGGYQKWAENNKGRAGDLHKIRWYRIVLDEAWVIPMLKMCSYLQLCSHAIKNFRSRTSLACQNLVVSITSNWIKPTGMINTHRASIDGHYQVHRFKIDWRSYSHTFGSYVHHGKLNCHDSTDTTEYFIGPRTMMISASTFVILMLESTMQGFTSYCRCACKSSHSLHYKRSTNVFFRMYVRQIKRL
jgi:hypothetical protein